MEWHIPRIIIEIKFSFFQNLQNSQSHQYLQNSQNLTNFQIISPHNRPQDPGYNSQKQPQVKYIIHLKTQT